MNLGHTTNLRQTVRRGEPDSQQLQVVESQPFIEPQTKPFKLHRHRADASTAAAATANKASRQARPSYKDEKAVEEANTQRRAISEEILLSGCVQSYVDFFYLTHRPDPQAAEREDGTAGMYILIPTSEMVFMKEQLTKAELARRKGETDVAFGAFEALAEYFRDLDDAKTAVYFYEKCSELARLTGDKARQMLSNNRLGYVYDKAGDLGSAIEYHEKHRELALAEDMKREVLKANAELVKVYMKFADGKESGGNYEEAIKFFEKALDAAKKSEDVAAEGRACYRLGTAYLKSKSNYDVAIKYLSQYEMISSSLKDMEGAGKAFEALAQAHQRVGDDEKGVTFLENFLKMATSTNNLKGQGEACSNLGVILSRRRQYKMAVTNFQRHYEIARDMVQSSQGSMAQLTEAQVYLGIARGNAMLNGYIAAVTGDMPTLLDWKINQNDTKISARR